MQSVDKWNSTSPILQEDQGYTFIVWILILLHNLCHKSWNTLKLFKTVFITSLSPPQKYVDLRKIYKQHLSQFTWRLLS